MPAPPSRPGHVEPFLLPPRATCQPLWDKTRAEREECLSISPPARGRCAAKRSLPPTLLARSRGKKLRFQGEADSARDISPKSGGRSSRVWLSAPSAQTFYLGLLTSLKSSIKFATTSIKARARTQVRVGVHHQTRYLHVCERQQQYQC